MARVKPMAKSFKRQKKSAHKSRYTKKLKGGWFPASLFSGKGKPTTDEAALLKVANPKKDYPIVEYATKIYKNTAKYSLILLTFGQKLLKKLKEEQMAGIPSSKNIIVPEELRALFGWGKTALENIRSPEVAPIAGAVKAVIISDFNKVTDMPLQPSPNVEKLFPKFLPEHYADLAVARRTLTYKEPEVTPSNANPPVNRARGPPPLIFESEGGGGPEEVSNHPFLMQSAIEDAVEQVVNLTDANAALESLRSQSTPPSPGTKTLSMDPGVYETFIGRPNMISDIINTFIKRYDYNKVSNPAKNSPTAILAHRYAIAILAIKGLFNAAKLALQIVTGVTTFGLGGGLAYAVLGNLDKLVSNTKGINVYFNSAEDCMLLLSPHKLWEDPALKAFIPRMILYIKDKPEILKDLPGFSVEIDEDAGIKKYKVFRTDTSEPIHNEKCADSTKILNIMFSQNALSKDMIELVSNELHHIFITSAHFRKEVGEKLLTKIFKGLKQAVFQD